MWVFLVQGFFSVVQKPGEKGLQVRARAAEDLDRLRALMKRLKLTPIGLTIHTPDGDYHYRALISKKAWGQAMGKIAASIDYSNFKQEVLREHGLERERLYSRVWSVMMSLQERVVRRARGWAQQRFFEDDDLWREFQEQEDNEGDIWYDVYSGRAVKADED